MDQEILYEYKINIWSAEGTRKVRNATVYKRNEEAAKAYAERDPYWGYQSGDLITAKATGKTNE